MGFWRAFVVTNAVAILFATTGPDPSQMKPNQLKAFMVGVVLLFFGLWSW